METLISTLHKDEIICKIFDKIILNLKIAENLLFCQQLSYQKHTENELNNKLNNELLQEIIKTQQKVLFEIKKLEIKKQQNKNKADLEFQKAKLNEIIYETAYKTVYKEALKFLRHKYRESALELSKIMLNKTKKKQQAFWELFLTEKILVEHT